MCVTLSTSEANNIALGDAVKNLCWRSMLSCEGMPCFPVFEDNPGALQLAEPGNELKFQAH